MPERKMHSEYVTPVTVRKKEGSNKPGYGIIFTVQPVRVDMVYPIFCTAYALYIHWKDHPQSKEAPKRGKSLLE